MLIATLLTNIKDVVPIYLRAKEQGKPKSHIELKKLKCFKAQNKSQEAATWASFLGAHNIGKQSKQCLLDVAGTVCLENKTAFENMSLSRRTTVRHVE